MHRPRALKATRGGPEVEVESAIRWLRIVSRKPWSEATTQFPAPTRSHHVAVEVVNRIHPSRFVALPKRWIVERTWSWLMNNRRLQIDYERDPIITEGFIWAAHSRYLLRRLTAN